MLLSDRVELAARLAAEGEFVVLRHRNTGALYPRDWRRADPPGPIQLRAFFAAWRGPEIYVVRDGRLVDPFAPAQSRQEAAGWPAPVTAPTPAVDAAEPTPDQPHQAADAGLDIAQALPVAQAVMTDAGPSVIENEEPPKPKTPAMDREELAIALGKIEKLEKEVEQLRVDRVAMADRDAISQVEIENLKAELFEARAPKHNIAPPPRLQPVPMMELMALLERMNVAQLNAAADATISKIESLKDAE